MSRSGRRFDVLVLGSGVAGLSAAVRAAAAPGRSVAVLTKGQLAQATTWWAQGGVAAVLGASEAGAPAGAGVPARAGVPAGRSPDADSTDLHLADTLAAGAGLCDVDAVRVLVDDGPAQVRELMALGAVFDRHPGGQLDLGREGGHSVARVVRANGAATGAEVERVLVAAVRASPAVLMEGWLALTLVVERGRCLGAVALSPSGATEEVLADHVVLATGGAGQLFAVTTNPPESTGDGLAMALRAGVAVADLELVQFHPTALHHPAVPRPLLSEALRGAGACLRDAGGRRFVDELASRDVVSRAMAARMADQGAEHLWLDATGVDRFAARFPTIAASLAGVGLDPASDWVPVAPAAHHLSGGVLTDLDGATCLPGLWACGEVACTGVHGANRLASNSLLEGLVFGTRVAAAIGQGVEGPSPTGAMRALVGSAVPGAAPHQGAVPGPFPVPGPGAVPELFPVPARRAGVPPGPAEALVPPGPAEALVLPGPAEALVPPGPAEALVPPGRGGPVSPSAGDAVKRRHSLQAAMSTGAGVLRSAESLAGAVLGVDASGAGPVPAGAAGWELGNLVAVARALLASAQARTESRGSHTRTDFPEQDPAWRVRLVHGWPIDRPSKG